MDAVFNNLIQMKLHHYEGKQTPLHSSSWLNFRWGRSRILAWAQAQESWWWWRGGEWGACIQQGGRGTAVSGRFCWSHASGFSHCTVIDSIRMDSVFSLATWASAPKENLKARVGAVVTPNDGLILMTASICLTLSLYTPRAWRETSNKALLATDPLNFQD